MWLQPGRRRCTAAGPIVVIASRVRRCHAISTRVSTSPATSVLPIVTFTQYRKCRLNRPQSRHKRHRLELQPEQELQQAQERVSLTPSCLASTSPAAISATSVDFTPAVSDAPFGLPTSAGTVPH